MSQNSNLGELTKDGLICLVNGHGKFGLKEEDFKAALPGDNLECNDENAIVGIMGCQSTGKSTLLNHLFGTEFLMMNSGMGRSQTTKGIWLDKARNAENLFVMDLEGTDSGERGEDRTTFERQTILYGLSLCEILIVNMWMTDIGRYTASNYGIMKTVFEVNLQIFKGTSKTQLLFLIRDYIPEVTPFDTLVDKLKKDMETIWGELSKPEGMESARMEDFFDFKFDWLPHYMLQKQAFVDRVEILKHKFIEPSAEGSFMATDYHNKKSVPVSGFVQYAKEIWDIIESNQDLNLPSQRELLASFRCDEVSAQILAQVDLSLERIRVSADAALVPNLGDELAVEHTGHLEKFDQLTHKYAATVVQSKRQELCQKLYARCEPVLSLHVQKFLVDSAVEDFSRTLGEQVKEGALCEDLYLITSNAKSSVANNFRAAITSLSGLLVKTAQNVLLDLVKSMCDRHLPQVEAKIDGVIESARKLQQQVLSYESANRLQKQLVEPVQELLKNAEPGMWSRLGAEFSLLVAKVALEADDVLDKLANDESERRSVMKVIVEQGEGYLKDVALQHARLVPLKMRGVFEAAFNRQDGSRRVWGVSHNVRKIFTEASDQALALLTLFQSFQLRNHWKDTGALLGSDKTDAIAPILLTDDQVDAFRAEFVLDAEAHCHDAMQEKERNMAQAKLPAWAIVLILVLGWNEIQAIITNPFFLVLGVILGLASLVVHTLGMWGPVMTVGQNLLGQALAQIQLITDALQDKGTTSQKPELSQMRRGSTAIDLDNLPPSATVEENEPVLMRRSTVMQ